MITFKQYISESTDDKGIFKAIFIVGLPGAGKSYTATKLAGGISPRVVNTDKATEFLMKKTGEPSTSQNWPKFKDDAHRITKGALTNYLNGVLPLIIDGTSNDASNILHRAGILESLGYDIGMVWIETPIQTAIDRANARLKATGREVGEDFIRAVEAQAVDNKKFFQGKFSFFKEIKNDEGQLTDAVLNDAFKKVSGFYQSAVSNPVGKRLLVELKEKGAKEIIPEIMTKEVLQKKIDGWYRT